MSHHETPAQSAADHEEMDSNSRADALALVSIIAIIVTMAVFFVSR